MTKFIFFSIQNGFQYEHLKKPLQFRDDPHGISNWVMQFPLTLYSFDLLQKHCFTQGKVTISKNNGNIDQQRWKYFVITKNNGTRLYCTSQLFYQKGSLTVHNNSNSSDENNKTIHQTFYLPKCLILISQEPYFKLHVNLIKIYSQIQKQRPYLTHITNPLIIERYLNLKNIHRLSQFCIQPTEYVGKKSSNSDIFHFYLNQCQENHFGETMLIQKASNLPVLHIYKLEQTKLYQFSHFFHLALSNKNLVNILTAILLEKQIIVTGKNSNLIVMIIESLLQLIKPLKWQHMLVHNIPTQLLDVVNESFLPFLVGINIQLMQNVDYSQKFVLFVDEDRFFMPTKLTQIGHIIEEFSQHFSHLTKASYSNEREVLEHSIQFMSKLMKPIASKQIKKTSNLGQFYQQFLKTSLYEEFAAKLGSSQLKQFEQLLSLDAEERKIEINIKMNRINSNSLNPTIKYNQIEWIEYYLAISNPNSSQRKVNNEYKMPSLETIQQNTINQANNQKMIKRLSLKSKSHIKSSRLKSCQKLKVSKFKHEQGVLLQLLQQRLGIDSILI